ncbi:MAG: dephospho-CoA kinase [Pseudomonadota bacterium]
MIILGLTGSIGMGKSATAEMFAELGAAVYDADAAVHALYARGGGAVEPIADLFPAAVKDGEVDRAVLGKLVLGAPEKLKALEAVVHPLVRQAQKQFLQDAEAGGAKLAVLDIPLLFETGGDALVDKVLVVTAPLEVQRARVLARPGMTEEKFDAIRAKQMPEADKRARADFIIETDKGLPAAAAEVEKVFHALVGESGST